MRYQRCLGLLVTACFLLLAGCSLFGEEEQPDETRVQTPDFRLNDLQGNEFWLSKHQGKVILLNFFRPGCTVCQSEVPELVALDEEFSDEQVVIVGIGLSNADVLRSFATDFNISYRVLPDNGLVFSGYGVAETPTSFLVNREGWLFGRYDGWISKDELAARIRTLL